MLDNLFFSVLWSKKRIGFGIRQLSFLRLLMKNRLTISLLLCLLTASTTVFAQNAKPSTNSVVEQTEPSRQAKNDKKLKKTQKSAKKTKKSKKQVAPKDRFKLTWVDLGFAHFYPIINTRLHDFSKTNLGGMFRLNFMVMNIEPLWLHMGFLVQSHIPNTHRILTLTDYSFNFGLGYRLWFPKGKAKGGGNSRWSFTPRASYGFLLHVTKGDYYNDHTIYPGDPRAGVVKTRYFSDSYFLFEPEFAVDITPKKQKKVQAELFFSPSIIIFPEKKRDGYEYGYIIGFRLKKGVGNLNLYLGGKAVDSKTGEVIPNVSTTVSGSAFDESKPQGQEQFAYQVSKTENYTITASAEGYEPASKIITKEELEPLAKNQRKFVELRLEKRKEWGIYGNVYLQEPKKPMDGVKVYIKEMQRKNEKVTIANASLKSTTTATGGFRILLKENSSYTIFFRKDGFFTVRGHFDTTGKKDGWYNLDKFMKVEMQEAVPGKKIDFESIYYDSGKWDIRPESMPVLNSMTEFFLDNPTVVVELSAHTDSLGNNKNNQILSQKRAESAVNVIVKNGIPKNRIIPKGYGEEKVLNRCVDGVRCSSKEHQQNRRTEFKVKAITKNANEVKKEPKKEDGKKKEAKKKEDRIKEAK